MAMRWYIIHVYSGFERKVEQAIREQAQIKGLADRFEEVMVPSEEVVEMRRVLLDATVHVPQEAGSLTALQCDIARPLPQVGQ